MTITRAIIRNQFIILEESERDISASTACLCADKLHTLSGTEAPSNCRDVACVWKSIFLFQKKNFFESVWVN
jgi:hypothetical protein